MNRFEISGKLFGPYGDTSNMLSWNDGNKVVSCQIFTCTESQLMRTKLKRAFSLTLNALLIVLLANAAWNYYQLSQSTNHIEQQALPRNARLFDLAGASFNLDQLTGKPTVLIFWATWCSPCTLEL